MHRISNGARCPRQKTRLDKLYNSTKLLNGLSRHHYLRSVCASSIHQKHNIISVSALKALRHVSALKGLFHIGAPPETQSPGDRAISLLYGPFLWLTAARVHTYILYTSPCHYHCRCGQNHFYLPTSKAQKS